MALGNGFTGKLEVFASHRQGLQSRFFGMKRKTFAATPDRSIVARRLAPKAAAF
jgi:hypothetical protein